MHKRAIKFTFDDQRVFDGFAAGGTWNGFDNVKVTVATAREIDAHFQAMADTGGWKNEECPIADIVPDEDGLIDLSDGYATQIVADEPQLAKWLITAEQRHGGMTVTSDIFELWLAATDEDDAREQGHHLLPRDWYATAAERA